ncbi:hypothetical protein A6723_024120 [Pseudomonas sp. AU11447]|uniref:hypothetical protein n=1 Tax=Pseudomonas sp. AU11447 TaxID=1843184 RepID=UPI0007ECC622|nr:hypothetical protein [Pseudomonas sp. AU11447]OBY91146.1 hypothetical protein A6723_024120 [Pseudomonas sp. AU11447]
MSKHTPGPWEVRNRVEVFSKLGADSGDGCLAHASDGWMIADCDPGVHTLTDEGFSDELGLGLKEANARLIAAAPELLDELKSLYRAYVRLLEAAHDRILSLGGDCDPVDKMESEDQNLRSAQATISKATA